MGTLTRVQKPIAFAGRNFYCLPHFLWMSVLRVFQATRLCLQGCSSSTATLPPLHPPKRAGPPAVGKHCAATGCGLQMKCSENVQQAPNQIAPLRKQSIRPECFYAHIYRYTNMQIHDTCMYICIYQHICIYVSTSVNISIGVSLFMCTNTQNTYIHIWWYV